ncbi:MAG: hypothetical protein DMG78_25025 [Acidobacteria bacterium]|nr:MAG: hypothetical protein DMG78_25025 [Acidobacteriota bacterium]
MNMRRGMKRNLHRTQLRVAAGAFCIFLLLPACTAQTVRPLINELGNPAKGRVEYVNDGLTPLNVVLEARSFTVSEAGEISYRPLDPDIHLKLSTTSFRIQPQQTYYVFYEASGVKSPSWFVIYAAFSGFPFRTAQGMNVRLELPHTVYLLPKGSVERADVIISRAELHPDENKVVVEVENQGDNFGRVVETQLVYDKKRQEAPGFPVFPHSKRILKIPLAEKAEAENVPVEVTLQFQKFRMEQKLQRAKSSDVVTSAQATTPVSGADAAQHKEKAP